MKPGIQPASSWILVGFLSAEQQRELPYPPFNHYLIDIKFSVPLGLGSSRRGNMRMHRGGGDSIAVIRIVTQAHIHNSTYLLI